MWRKSILACSATGLTLLDARIRLGLGAAGGLASGERPLGEDLLARAELLDGGPSVLGAQRPVVALVDRRHRRQVTRPHALERLEKHLTVRGARAAVVGLVRVDARD